MTQVLTSIGIIVVSFIVGFLFFYIISFLPKDDKKKQIEELTSLLINYVIFIWVGKMISNFSLLISDPLAVLAYPSNSHAFYIATFLIVLNIIYKVKRYQFNVELLMYSFLPVFLFSSFIYEFIQIVWYGNSFTWIYLGLLMALLIIFLFLHGKVHSEKTFFFLLSGWGIGQLILAVIMPYTTVFGYMIAPWFLGLILIVNFVLFFYNNRKRVS